MISLKTRIIALASRPDAEMWLGVVALAEGLWPAISLDTLLPRIALLRVEKAWRYAFIATMGSVVGALVAYLVGWLLWLTLGRGIAMVMGLEDAHVTMVDMANSMDVLLVLAAGISPLPFKLVALGMGFFQASLVQVLVAALIARGARFWWTVWLMWRHGPRTLPWFEQHQYGISMMAALALLLALIMMKTTLTG